MGWINRIRLRRLAQTARIEDVLVPINFPEISEAVAGGIRDGLYEAAEIALLKRHFEPADIVLELGGGIGFISTAAAMRLRPGAVTVVEADRRMLDIIKTTHRLNRTAATVKWGAVSGGNSGESYVDFFERDDFLIGSLSADASPWTRKVRVPRFSLPALVAKVKPSFLIVDIEGAEEHIFDGVTDLGPVVKILIEIHSHLLGDDQVRRLNKTLERLGFLLQDTAGLTRFYRRS